MSAEHIYKDRFLQTSCEIEGQVGMYTHWKEQGILENFLRTLCVCFFPHARCCSHMDTIEHLLSVHSVQDPGVLSMQHRSGYNKDAVWRHGRLQSHGVHSFWDAVAAVKLPCRKAWTVPLDGKHKS